jgi:asparagine synthase (glutamine-hydrolysing)
VLYLARDRFGEKPLYYAWSENTFLFASELKALVCHPSFTRRVDSGALASFLTFNYIQGEKCIFERVTKLPPGNYIKVRVGEEPGRPSSYWRFEDFVQILDRHEVQAGVGVEDIDAALRKAVELRMVADVPIGAFLSGGIDSSLIVAIMQEVSGRRVKTFTLGFNDKHYDEAKYASRVAKHLSTDHHEKYLDGDDCVDAIRRLPKIYDEPFADSSQIPTVLVCEFARKYVTVALSGDGGDEFFGGYNRYMRTDRYWRAIAQTPRLLRLFGAFIIESVESDTWDDVLSASPLGRFTITRGGEKLRKVAQALRARDINELYAGFVENVNGPLDLMIASSSSGFRGALDHWRKLGLSTTEQMMARDITSYLPGDILTKVDRASMSVGLELRVPFLDNEVARLAWLLPLDAKIRDGVGKVALRELLFRRVPSDLFSRPKAGFGAPIGEWLRGPLRDWAEHLLSPALIGERGLKSDVVRRIWSDHQMRKVNAQHVLWCVLMYQAWYDEYINVS